MKNVIYINDSLIGTYEDIWKYYKEELINQMNDNGISFQELNNNFSEILSLMEKLEDNKDIYSNTLISIKETPMGSLTYKVLKEDE